MAKDFSPEEKLLRLIKGKRKSTVRPEEIAKPKEEEKKAPPVEEKRQPQKEKEVPSEAPSPEEKRPEQLKIKIPKKLTVFYRATHLYIILGIISVLLLAIFIFHTLSKREREELIDLETIIASISGETERGPLKPKEEEAAPKEELPEGGRRPKPAVSFEEYQKLLREKSIFAPPVRGKTPVSTKVTLRELIKDLRLVGIMPGDEPQAIIEDKKSGQTFFLEKGEQIEDIEIREISNGKVILGYGEETITLSL